LRHAVSLPSMLRPYAPAVPLLQTPKTGLKSIGSIKLEGNWRSSHQSEDLGGLPAGQKHNEAADRAQKQAFLDRFYDPARKGGSDDAAEDRSSNCGRVLEIGSGSFPVPGEKRNEEAQGDCGGDQELARIHCSDNITRRRAGSQKAGGHDRSPSAAAGGV